MEKKLILNLCPTGMVPQKSKVPFVPITPKEIGKDVKRCYELGVSMVHIHARDDNGNPIWAPQKYEEIIAEIKTISSELIICVSTSGRNWQEIEKREAVLDIAGSHKPDMASLTLGSLNFPTQASVNSPETIAALANKMNANKIVPELEVFDVGMLNYADFLINKGILKPPYYFNLLLGSLGSASFNARNIAAMIDSLPKNAVWSLAGIGRYQLAANTMAVALGGHVRIGIEDNPYYDWGTKSHASNPKLVERIIRIAKEFGREPASPTDSKKIIGI